jgi:hypothetical protein
MKPIEFKGFNVTFAKNQSEYLPLPAFKSDSGEVVSCWSLNLRERIKMAFTGKLWLHMLTFNHPLQPQRPSVDCPLTYSDEVV